MNFDLSEDDAALQDSVARWVQQRYPFDARRKLAAQAPGFSREHWREMAQLGWLALPFDEALGGLGGGPLGTMLMMEQLGKGLVLEPYLPTVLLFGGLVQRSAALRDDWVPKIIDGSVLGALAWQERAQPPRTGRRADHAAAGGRRLRARTATRCWSSTAPRPTS